MGRVDCGYRGEICMNETLSDKYAAKIFATIMGGKLRKIVKQNRAFLPIVKFFENPRKKSENILEES